MRRTPRSIVAGLALAASLALAGCGNSTLKAADTSAPGFGTAAKGTITVWCRATTLPAEDQIAARFNKLHPKLHVNVTSIPDSLYVTKLATAIRGGYVPDIVDADDINASLLIHYDAFDDLTPLLDKLPYRAKLNPAMLDLSRSDGHVYAVPFAADVSLLFYSKTLFARAHLHGPPRTLSAEFADAKAITALGHGIKGYSFGGDSPGLWAFTVMPSTFTQGHIFRGPNGHQTAYVQGNQPLAQTLSFEREMWRDHLVTASSRTQTGTTWGQDFASGTVGMWPGDLSTIVATGIKPKFKVGAVTLPGVHAPGAFAGGDSMAIPRGAGNPSGAWEYVRYALATAQQKLVTQAGLTPVRSDSDTAALRRAQPLVATALRAASVSYAPLSVAYNTTMNQESGPWSSLTAAAAFGGEPINELLRKAQSKFGTSIKQAES